MTDILDNFINQLTNSVEHLEEWYEAQQTSKIRKAKLEAEIAEAGKEE